jgi:hypothetical protein
LLTALDEGVEDLRLNEGLSCSSAALKLSTNQETKFERDFMGWKDTKLELL